jgi:RNA polymerase sigma factor (sigma-70 family)
MGGVHDDRVVTIPDGTRDTEAAFASVYRAARPGLLRLAHLMVRSQAVAEELVHDAFLRLHGHFDAVENPPAFLRTTLVRLCLTWSTRHRGELDRWALVGADTVVLDPPVDAGADEDMWAALGRLTPDRRTAVVLRYYVDLTHAEIAAHMGCAVPTARAHVHRGLRDLRKEMS